MITNLFFNPLAVTLYLLHHVVPGFGSDKVSVSVIVGDSVTLHTGVLTNLQDDIQWYLSNTRIAQVSGDHSFICTDVQCNEGTERFRDRLKLDHQNGSLTIINIKTTDSGEYKLKIISRSDREKIFNVSVTDVPPAEPYEVKEGESVTLEAGLMKHSNIVITWYFNQAEITGDQSKICTDDQCIDKDRLKLDQTGSLTITNTRTTDSGVYKLQIIIGGSSVSISRVKIFSVSVTVVPGFGSDKVSVSLMKGDSVTLHTGVQTNQQDDIQWYFNNTRIAQISGDLSYICTDVQCNNGTERFRDRLKLDHQTGSLTITDISSTDSGVYRLRISSRNTISDKIFVVAVYGVSAAERDKMKRKSVKEGESVTFDPGVMKEQTYLMTWYFNDTRITEITGDPSKTCTYGQCGDPGGRFRDRLKLDQTGSLTITNITITDSGEYKLLINSSSRISIIKIFSVTVTDVPDSRVSPTEQGVPAAAVVVVVVLLVTAAAAAAVIYYRHRKSSQARPNGRHFIHLI